ncbi:MAG: LptF/LptG family permease [candidate division Zixibacteria bacterium]|nr:LptF/LptG family permease [candidate division Zixibacteria bacterium]
MIKRLDRYLLWRFILSLIVAVGTITLIALIVDLIENLERIVDNAATLKDVVLYYVYFIPWIYKITIPASVLLAGLFSIGLLAKNNEILAMKAAGVSLYRIAMPLLIFTFFLSCFNFYFNEELLPIATKERNRIKHGEIEKKDQRKGQILYNLSKQGAGGYIYHFELFKTGRKEAKNALVQRFENDTLMESYRAEWMRFSNGQWHMINGVHRDFSGNRERFFKFDSLILASCKERPEEFEKYRGKPEDMGYRELEGYIGILKKTGAPFARELVDLRTKLSFPFTSFIVMFICIPMASNPSRSGVAMSFAIAAGVSLLYFVIFKVTQSFGYSGKLPPDMAAWSINVLFFIIGIFFFIRSHK